jgi:tight adherence protein C
MPIELAITLTAVFISLALITGAIASRALARTAPELRRLQPVTAAAVPSTNLLGRWRVSARARASAALLKPKDGSRVRRRLTTAGWDEPHHEWLYSVGQITLPIVSAAVPLFAFGFESGWALAAFGAVLGYLLPDLLVSRKIGQQKLEIQHGLPDALDLLIVCIEAGSSLDQAIVRASEELDIALPAMAVQLRTVASEIRAGKPRVEAFQAFARRTRSDDVGALVTMLIQCDRYGTSVAQAMRVHAQTLRTKRRQAAEERAGKVGVKLVFPLVLCLLPALYLVCLGPVTVRMIRAFS